MPGFFSTEKNIGSGSRLDSLRLGGGYRQKEEELGVGLRWEVWT